MLLAKSIPDVTLNGSVLGEFPMVHFQNLVKIRITNSFEAPQTETLRINSQTLRTVEILNSTGAFPWGIFGDADKPIEFPNVEQMLICTRTGQQLRQRTQIKRFQLRFPKLSNIILIGAMDMYTDVLELTRFPKVTSVGILDNVEKLKSIDPRIIRRLTKFHFGESQEDRVTVLPSDCFFVKIFDVPSPVTNALLALPYFDFPQIKKVRWSKLANLMLSVNSMSLETIELLMLQLPRMHSLNISMIKSDPKAAGDAVCSRKTPLSKTLGDMYFIIAEPTLRDEAWVEMVVQRLPALFRLTVQEYFKRTDERLRQSYKNGLAYA
ncbi:hypothetical protein FBU59_006827 [Linderina macrospora]|uniref:Uncharacterized protein n=1 Tax=Linderina macrospora TaxID=4868 RepID=A0ACC1IYU3_9FUNG|nr:hypothetical protein FBU59_006827 [Linderina macrospora]